MCTLQYKKDFKNSPVLYCYLDLMLICPKSFNWYVVEAELKSRTVGYKSSVLL